MHRYLIIIYFAEARKVERVEVWKGSKLVHSSDEEEPSHLHTDSPVQVHSRILCCGLILFNSDPGAAFY